MPTPSRLPAAVVVVCLLAVACVPPGQREAAEGPEAAGEGRRPTFAPATAPPSPPSVTTPPPDASPGPATTPGRTPTATGTPSPAAPGTGTTPPPAAPPLATGGIRDPAGDVAAPPLGDPPDYADLRGAALRLEGDDATLRIRLEGGAPERSSEDHTLNIASFYDIDGDGLVDYEVWANASPDGWGTAWFDNEQERAFFGADDDVSVDVVDGEVVLGFTLDHLGGARAFRWSLAAEWGTFEALATGQTTRDDAPDGGRPAAFPG